MELPDSLRVLTEYAPDALLVLDFDGTISRLVEHPNDAVAIEGVIDVLCELTAHLRVAFITGRPVDWLMAATQPCAVAGVEFIGLHGHERLRRGEIVPHIESAPWRATIAEVLSRVEAASPQEVVIEAKGLGLALHFRTSPVAETWIREFTTQVAADTGLVAHDTRYAIELRPPVDLDKGDAMHELIDEYAPAAVAFFGDDRVDIPAVHAMRHYPDVASVAVYVESHEGPQEFAELADLVLPSPDAAAESLFALRAAFATE